MEERLRRVEGSRAASFATEGEELLGEIRAGVATITLNRPRAHNALSAEMIRGLAEWLEAFARDDNVRVVAFKGAGGRAFCAGGDIRAVYQAFHRDRAALAEFFREEYALDHRIHTFPKPIFSLMDGIVMGGGMGISQGTAMRVVGDHTRMAMPETRIGLFPDVGASYFLSRTPGGIGLYLGLVGATIRSADALHCGLADVDIGHAEGASFDRMVEAAAREADPVSAFREAVRRLGHPAHASELERLRPAIDHHFSQPGVKAIVESLRREGRPELREWAARTVHALEAHSPTLLEVTFEQLRRGARLPLADCFRMELGLVHACFDHGDFMEGIRALAIDKDHRPRWRPDTLEAVRRDLVEAFFAPRWEPARHPLAHL